MKIFAQHGYGAGENCDKIIAGLEAGAIDGAIVSPKDFGLDRTLQLLAQMEVDYPDADRLFDPQFYASLVANAPEGRLGKLIGDEWAYFRARRRSQLEVESAVREDLRRCLEAQMQLPVTAVIAPSILVRQRINSIESVIAKNFVRHARQVWEEVGDGRPLLATLAVDSEALHDHADLLEFLADLTLLGDRPDGFYVLVSQTTSDIPAHRIESRTLAGWMLINHVLRINEFEVHNGFSDILTPFLGAAGGTSGATGWFGTQKVFSMDRYAPRVGGGRRPVARYLSKRLLNSIRFDELHRLRDEFPGVLNGLDSDAFYSEEAGSEPDGLREEALQTWDTLASFESEGALDLDDCAELLDAAESLYDEIDASAGVRLSGRSNSKHLESFRDGLELFAELAEVNLGD